MKEIRQNPSYDKLKLTKVSGILEAKNNRFELAVITKQIENKIRNDSPTLTLPMPRYLIGDVDVNKLVEILNSKGFENIHLNRDRFDKFLIDIVSSRKKIVYLLKRFAFIDSRIIFFFFLNPKKKTGIFEYQY